MLGIFNVEVCRHRCHARFLSMVLSDIRFFEIMISQCCCGPCHTQYFDWGVNVTQISFCIFVTIVQGYTNFVEINISNMSQFSQTRNIFENSIHVTHNFSHTSTDILNIFDITMSNSSTILKKYNAFWITPFM